MHLNTNSDQGAFAFWSKSGYIEMPYRFTNVIYRL